MASVVREAILTLARTVRSAETVRIADSKRALDIYDEALHGRSLKAVEYLKTVKAADDRYQEAVRAALDEYAETVEIRSESE